ncbi:MAG: hypothetical protein KUG73_07945 [Pseudomonadales bacterium]|nr:hypothetical protein [Pseudomonadales bacterium]
MQLTVRHFYQFSGFHSLLIGLLPFFLPVILWDNGASLAQISAFIAITGIGFIGSLWVWDQLRANNQWRWIITLSFVAEILLIAALAWNVNSRGETSIFLIGTALLNGVYNCFYWSTQRAIFNQITSNGNTGKTFGNFQILVVILLKIGILSGGYLLETSGTLPLIILSLAISTIALWKLIKTENTSTGKAEEPKLTFKHVKNFSDKKNSKVIFFLDGPFLFLESYFWVLSLYFLTQESFFTLGFVIVTLTLLLSGIFYFIKNAIDKMDQQKIFFAAVLLYAASWLLRSQTNTEDNNLMLYTTILVIGFLTTFFRLVFNKRFFDTAREDSAYQYLIYKSYYSQMGIVLFFGALATYLYISTPLSLAISSATQAAPLLATTYLWVCPIALIYGIYCAKARLPSRQLSKRETAQSKTANTSNF